MIRWTTYDMDKNETASSTVERLADLADGVGDYWPAHGYIEIAQGDDRVVFFTSEWGVIFPSIEAAP